VSADQGGSRPKGRPPSCPRILAVRILVLYRDGLSPARIGALLKEEGVPMPCGGMTWERQTVERILHTDYARRLAEELDALPPPAEQYRSIAKPSGNVADYNQRVGSPAETPNPDELMNAAPLQPPERPVGRSPTPRSTGMPARSSRPSRTRSSNHMTGHKGPGIGSQAPSSLPGEDHRRAGRRASPKNFVRPAHGYAAELRVTGNEDGQLDRPLTVQEQPIPPATWPGFALRLAELLTENWGNVLRLCAFLMAFSLVGLAWWWLQGLLL
jgi:hypothetical protein